MKTSPALCRFVWLASVAAACLASAGGCSSVIGSAYLREAWLDAVEQAEESRAVAGLEHGAMDPSVGNEAEIAAEAARDREAAVEPIASAAAEDAVRSRYTTLDEAIAGADRALVRSGGLSVAARDTLTTMLQTVPKQDWPVVVDEFAASLAAAAPPPRTALIDGQPAGPADASDAPLPPMPPSQPTAAAAVEPAVAPPADVGGPVAGQSVPKPAAETPAPETLAVQNPCFATRVRAWGAVDRFEHSRFVPGQEVIVYFELDQLATRETADGHTTRVDTRLRMVGHDGRKVHEWTFEPLEETCRSRRRDYFARYVLTLPEGTPAGPYRLEISVTDAVGGSTAQAVLPLEIQVR